MKVGQFEIETVKKDIKNIHLGVYPPNGKIRVASPKDTSDEKIRTLVISKIPWIRKQQKKFFNQIRQGKREYISGESHYFLGRRYLLNVIDTNKSPQIEMKRKKYINMYVNKSKDIEKRKELLDSFYREELKRRAPPLIQKWERILGVSVSEFKVKKMKTKWGSCNSKNRRIWINLELAKKSPNCLEYVLVHEMAHFLVKNHNERFKDILDRHMTNWEAHKRELENSVLSSYF